MKRLKKDIARVMDEAVARGETPGVIALLWRHGEEKLYHASGFADLGRNTPIERDTVMRLYSLTKPMLAVTAMTLVERGDLDLITPVSEFLSGYRNQRVATGEGKSVPAKNPMLVRDLFTMTSGLCYGGDEGPAERAMAKLFSAFEEETAAGNQPDTITAANRIGELPLAFEPGTRWKYGTSADVLGAVVEVVSGKPLDQYMREVLFEPLRMEETGFFVPEEQQPRLATLYEHKDGILSPYLRHDFVVTHGSTRPNFISGGAGLSSTTEDVLRFARMMLGEGELYGERILTPRSHAWLTRNHLNETQAKYADWDNFAGYGYGGLMRVMMDPAKSFGLGVTGEYGWDGWSGVYMTVCPEEDLTFIVMQQKTNTGASVLTRKLCNVLYAHLS